MAVKPGVQLRPYQEPYKLQVFVNKCLRYILGVWWPNVISNEELLRRTYMETIVTSVMRRKWRRIGRTLRRDSNNVARLQDKP